MIDIISEMYSCNNLSHLEILKKEILKEFEKKEIKKGTSVYKKFINFTDLLIVKLKNKSY